MEYMDLMGWLDNEHLVLVRYQEETYLDPLIVLNPFTGQQVELLPDYPDIDFLNGTVWWDTSRTVYDPTLTLVVYPRSGFNHDDITLWDIPNNQPLASVPGYVGYGELPEWSPDGEYVSIIGQSPAALPDGYDLELYLVSRVGVVTQATNLSQYYTDIFIQTRNWSPDGRYIAYWLWARPIGYEGDTYPMQLLLLDTATMETANTCIPGGELSGGPDWSPDGRWLAVNSLCGESNEDCILLVNVIDGYAVRIIDQWIVDGWMVSP
jgi:WD40 repeat protein